MSMHNHAAQHAASHLIKHCWHDLPKLKERRDPVIAGTLGFFLGGIGLGMYFRSWKDGVYPVIVFTLLTIVCPIGLGELAACILTAVWGVARALDSGPPRIPPPAGPGSSASGATTGVTKR